MNSIEKTKQAATDFPIHPLLSSRWSPRAYRLEPIETEKLQRIFEAARWAASASNLQPWYFLVGFKGDEVYEKIFSTLVEFNQLWVKNAPVLVLAIGKTTNPKGDANGSFGYDLGQSVAILSIQAMHEGIYTHQMSGFNMTEAASLLEIPADFEIKSAFTLGYLGEAEQLHPNLLKAETSPRTRRPISESVFTGSFGHKADFL